MLHDRGGELVPELLVGLCEARCFLAVRKWKWQLQTDTVDMPHQGVLKVTAATRTRLLAVLWVLVLLCLSMYLPSARFRHRSNCIFVNIVALQATKRLLPPSLQRRHSQRVSQPSPPSRVWEGSALLAPLLAP